MNIIKLADITKDYCVTMETMKEKVMIIHIKDIEVKFNQKPGGLCAKNPVQHEDDN